MGRQLFKPVSTEDFIKELIRLDFYAVGIKEVSPVNTLLMGGIIALAEEIDALKSRINDDSTNFTKYAVQSCVAQAKEAAAKIAEIKGQPEIAELIRKNIKFE